MFELCTNTKNPAYTEWLMWKSGGRADLSQFFGNDRARPPPELL